jgi:hypothetical protein
MQFCSRSDILKGTLKGHKEVGWKEKKIRGCKKQSFMFAENLKARDGRFCN